MNESIICLFLCVRVKTFTLTLWFSSQLTTFARKNVLFGTWSGTGVDSCFKMTRGILKRKCYELITKYSRKLDKLELESIRIVMALR